MTSLENTLFRKNYNSPIYLGPLKIFKKIAKIDLKLSAFISLNSLGFNSLLENKFL